MGPQQRKKSSKNKPKSGANVVQNGGGLDVKENIKISNPEVPDLTLPEKKSIKFAEWSQTVSDVTIVLFSGKCLSDNDVAVNILPTSLHIGFTDGRKWWCDLNREVVTESVKVVVKKLKVSVTLKKKEEKQTWASLEKAEQDSGIVEPENSGVKPVISTSQSNGEKVKVNGCDSRPQSSSKNKKCKVTTTNDGLTSTSTQPVLQSVSRDLNESSGSHPFSANSVIYSISSHTINSSDTSLVYSTHTTPLSTPTVGGNILPSITDTTTATRNAVSTSYNNLGSEFGSVLNGNSSAYNNPGAILDAINSTNIFSNSTENVVSDFHDFNPSVLHKDATASNSQLSYGIKPRSRTTSNEAELKHLTDVIVEQRDSAVLSSSSSFCSNIAATADLYQMSSGYSSCDINEEALAAVEGASSSSRSFISAAGENSRTLDGTDRVGFSDCGAVRDDGQMCAGGMKSEADNEQRLEDVMELVHVRHDSYESSTSIHTLTVMVKCIKKNSLKITFDTQSVDILFQTTDRKFLELYEGKTEDTWFHWKIDPLMYCVGQIAISLSGWFCVDSAEIVSSQCSYRVTEHKVEVQLHKKLPRKWTSLTAPPAAPTAAGCEAAAAIGGVAGGDSQWKPIIPAPPPPPPQIPSLSAGGGVKFSGKKGGVKFDELSQALRSRAEADEYFEDDIVFSNTELRDKQQKPMCAVAPQRVCDDDDDDDDDVNDVDIRRAMARDSIGSRGLVGLDNLGNTCFMNSVLQVLANTTQLRDYFLSGAYTADVNKMNPLGMSGHLAEAFSSLMRILWTGNQHSYAPYKLKTLIGEKQSRFAGFSQHDAEEFMEFLLDGLHEDVNRIKVKPYTSEPDADSYTNDKAMADRAWLAHRSRNDSLVSDTFQGQYRSKLTCPHCNKVSITFDPFSVIQVPVARKQIINVTVMWLSPSRRPSQVRLSLGEGSKMRDVKAAICQQTNISPYSMRILKISRSRVISTLNDDRLLAPNSSISDDNTALILACEVFDSGVVGETVRELVIHQRTQQSSHLMSSTDSCANCGRNETSTSEPVKLKKCSQCFTVAYCNVECQRKDWTRHKMKCQSAGPLIGCPFVISLPVSRFTLSNLMQQIESYASKSLNSQQQQQQLGGRSNSCSNDSADEVDGGLAAAAEPSCATSSVCSSEQCADESNSNVSESRSREGSVEGQRVRQVIGTRQDEIKRNTFPFTLRLCSPDGSLTQELRADKTMFNKTDEDGLLNLPLSVSNVCMVWSIAEGSNTSTLIVQNKPLEREEMPLNRHETNYAMLDDCLKLFTEPEVLSADQSWYCPRCKKHCQATKQMSLWRLPDNVIIHLKRFSFSAGGFSFLSRGKVDDHIVFPLKGLNLSPYLSSLTPVSGGEEDRGTVYDLYATVNHYGSMLCGHYTAFAQSNHPYNNSHIDWRLFDDSRVTSCDPEDVQTRYAYVLFYRRRCQTSDTVSSTVNPTINTLVNHDKDCAVDSFTDTGIDAAASSETRTVICDSESLASAAPQEADLSEAAGTLTQISSSDQILSSSDSLEQRRLVVCVSDDDDDDDEYKKPHSPTSSDEDDDSFTRAVSAAVSAHQLDNDDVVIEGRSYDDDSSCRRGLLDPSDDDDDDDDDLSAVVIAKPPSPQLEFSDTDMDAMD